MSPEGQHVDGTTNSKNCRTLGAGYPNLWSYILGLRIEKDTGGDIVCKLTHSNCASFQLCTFQTNHRQSKHTHNCMPFLFEYSAHFKLSGRWHLSETGYCCTNFTDPLRPPPLYCMLLWIGTGISQTDGILQDHQKSAQLEMWGIWSRRFATSMIDLK